MNPHKFLTRLSTGVAVLGMALCIPAAMLAQDTAPAQQAPPDAQSSPGQPAVHSHQPPSPERQLHRLTKSLNLTPDQQKQMLPILQDHQKQMSDIQSNTGLSQEQRHQQMHAARADNRQKLEALMTDTQKQQFEQNVQQRHNHMENRGTGAGGGAGAPPPPADGQDAPPPPPDGQSAPAPPPQ